MFVRKSLFLPVAIASLWPTANAAALSSAFNDWVIVPKVRVGPIGKYTSVQALRSIMPNAVMRHQTDSHGEKTIVIYRTTNRQHSAPDLTIRWRKRHRVISQITIYQFAGPWRTPMGIRMSTSLESVHKANGVRFMLIRRKGYLHAKSFSGGKIPENIEFAFRQPTAAGDLRQTLPADVHSGHPQVQGKKFRIVGIVIHFP